MVMIDGFRPKRRVTSLHPADKAIFDEHMRERFVPPEEVAAAEEQQPGQGTASGLVPGAPTPPKRSLKAWWSNLGKNRKLAITGAAALLTAGIVVGAYFLFFAPSPKPVVVAPPPKKAQVVVPPKPTTVASNLSGLQVDPSVNDRPVTGIMMENSVLARPQSGLNQASVVFEAVAEGGITRFLTLFQDTQPDYIGPVRSVRPYYIRWALGFDAAIAHAGGSKEGLDDMKAWSVKDLNDSSAYFMRISDRAAPHNLYTSIAKLNAYEAAKGYGTAHFTSLVRKAESASKTPTARAINFNISGADFAVHYDYNATTNSYDRSEGGAKHIDQRSGAQLSPKVVVALIMPQGKADIYTTYETIGSGIAYIFQDGGATQVTWHKDSNAGQFTFTDANGQAVGLNPGQTWFTALGAVNLVSYSP